MQEPAWTKLFSQYAIDDALRAKAYESIDFTKRACLKNAIAFHALEPCGASSIQVQTKYAHKGYWCDVQINPVPWVVCVCSSSYVSPARLIASLMPCLLAEVPHVYFISLGTMPNNSLLLALELLGVENSISLADSLESYKLIEKFLGELTNNAMLGRVLLLGQTKSDFSKYYENADNLRIPTWQDANAPNILGHGLSEEEWELLRWAQPDAHFSAEAMAHLHAIYGYEQDLEINALQMWARGMEACFVHENLNKGFFQNKVLAAGSILNEGKL